YFVFGIQHFLYFICGFSLGEHFLYLLCKYIGGGGIYISINALLPLVILLGSVEIFLNCYGICLSFLPNVFVHYIKNQKAVSIFIENCGVFIIFILQIFLEIFF